MKSGDCSGAIDAFDGALRVFDDATIIRDRGLCNEKLGYTHPAIDDFRVYLTRMPDAADAERVREHLARLEGNGATANDDVPDLTTHASKDSAKDTTDKDSASDKDTAAEGPHDQLEPVDREAVTTNSPLRAGNGVMLYPFFAERKLFAISGTDLKTAGTTTKTTFSDSSWLWSESIGAGFRYSFGPSGSLVIEAGYERFNANDVDLVSMSAFTSLVAYELRFPMAPTYENQLFLAFGVGYEHLVTNSSDPGFAPWTLGGILPRARFGYRRMLGHSLSLDASLDAGAAVFFEYSGPALKNEPLAILGGANIGLVWGL
jgi:hypothetical protein